MIHRYSDYVDKEKISFKGNIEENIRYLLRIPLKNSGNKKVLVVMKNPSKANAEISDLTINRVLTFCNNEGYSEVSIMNLFAYYSTNSGKIAKLIKNDEIKKAIGNDNDSIMKNILVEVNDVIIGWGSNTFGCTREYKKRIKQVVEIIKDKKIYYLEKLGGKGWYPRHAQVWSVNQGIKKYIWSPDLIK